MTTGGTPIQPVQEFFSIGEVCQLTDLKPHVLRYWESQFRFLNPAKNRSGNRVYQRREIELIMLVKGREAEDRALPAFRRAQAGDAAGARHRNRQGAPRRAEVGTRHSRGALVIECPAQFPLTPGWPS